MGLHLARLGWFYLGLTFMALGHALIIHPGVGAAPWDIFHLAVHGLSGIPLAQVIQLTGFVIIGLNLLLGIRPTLGMVLNMVSFGPIMGWWLTVLPMPGSVVERWLMLLLGIFVVGIGTACYVSAALGSGPRDGMMLGLHAKTGLAVGLIKNGMDVTVTLLGFLLGGPLGVGTVVVALGLGPSVQFGVVAVRWLSKQRGFSRFVTPVGSSRS